MDILENYIDFAIVHNVNTGSHCHSISMGTEAGDMHEACR